MADGYIENKMMQHRSGTQPGSAAIRRRNALDCAMPQRRVLIVGGCGATTEAIARIFAESGCRVSLLTSDNVAQCQSATLRSVRVADPGLTRLLAAWGDVDIIVFKNDSEAFSIDSIITTILSHRKSLPLPNSYGGRIILISDREDYPAVNSELPENITLNLIRIESMSAATIESVGRTCLFLSLPWAGNITSSRIVIK